MTKYRTISLEINAIRNEGIWAPIRDWLVELADNGAFVFPVGSSPPITRNEDGSLNIHYHQQSFEVPVGDWLIKNVTNNSFYSVTNMVFELRYELVK